MTFIENLLYSRHAVRSSEGFKDEDGTVFALLKQCVVTILRREHTVISDWNVLGDLHGRGGIWADLERDSKMAAPAWVGDHCWASTFGQPVME